jgi:regulator of sigma E protease
MTLTSLIIFFVILFFLVVIHEADHFVFAKLSKMRVDEFAFGFPPRLLSNKIGETVYSFNLTPLGGYVKIFGENGLNAEEKSKLSESEKEQLFENKKISRRLLVLVGGVLFNVIGAYFLFFFALLGNSKMFVAPEQILPEDAPDKKLLLVEINEKSSLNDADLKRGMEIVGVEVEKDKVKYGINKSEINSANLSEFIQKYNDSEISILFENSNNVNTIEVVKAIPKPGIVDGKKVLGASFANQVTREYTFFKAIVDAGKITFTQTMLIFTSIYDLIKNLIYTEAKVEDNLAGPIGLAIMTSKVADRGLSDVLIFAAMLSLSLAVFNILRIRALDGGRIVFVLLEAVRRKKN